MIALTANIGNFLSRRGRVLCIFGDTGVGKTSYAISLVRDMDVENVLYVTSGISYDEMLHQFPFLPEVIPQENFIDLLQLSDAEVDKYGKSQGLLTFPSYLGYVLDRLDRLPEPKVLIVDDWSIIFSTVEMRSRIGYETVDIRHVQKMFLKTAREKTQATIVVENMNKNLQPSEILFFMADGVLKLDMNIDENGFPFRTVTVKKLRGTRIDQVIYPFTISEGKIITFLPQDIEDYDRVRIRSGGITALENKISGKENTLVVVDNINASKEMKKLLLDYIIKNVATGKRLLTFLPSLLELEWEGPRLSVTVEELSEVLQRTSCGVEALRSVEEWDVAVLDATLLMALVKNPTVSFIKAMEYARETGKCLVLVGSFTEEERGFLIKFADVYVKILSRYGVNFIKPCKPRTEYLALTLREGEVELVPML